MQVDAKTNVDVFVSGGEENTKRWFSRVKNSRINSIYGGKPNTILNQERLTRKELYVYNVCKITSVFLNLN